MAYKICFISLSAWARTSFSFNFFGNSLYHYDYKLAKLQSDWFFVPIWFLQGPFTLKHLTSIFQVSLLLHVSPPAISYRWFKWKARFGVSVVLDRTTWLPPVELYCFCIHPLAISVSDCQLSHGTVILISSPLEDLSVKVSWSFALWECSGDSSFCTAKITRRFWRRGH